ncbi:MAG: hypothetical protein V7603_4175 [Micromonosporaceae bacterium]
MDDNEEPREQPGPDESAKDIWGINLGDYDDPTEPPEGFKAIECPGCTMRSLKPAQGAKLAMGPIPGVGAPAGQARSFCPRCRGRTWIWWRTGREIV